MFEKIFRDALEIRALENKLLEAYAQRLFGGTVHTCIGQELLPVILASYAPDNAFIFSNHRGHGHFIAHTKDIRGLFREFLGKYNAPSGGVGGSQHLYATNFLSNGIQGNTAPFAVGVGLVRPTIIYLGDGTFGEGALYESLNLASYLKSDILFVVEDNGISQTTPSNTVNMGEIGAKFRAFNIPVTEADSAELDSLTLAMRACMDSKGGPRALVVKSYRLNSHSKGDDTRPPQTVSALPDPLQHLSKKLDLVFDREYGDVKTRVDEIFASVVTEENSSFSQSLQFLPERMLWSSFESYNPSTIRVNESIRDSIGLMLDEGSLFIGEDIVTKWDVEDNPYGGAFGVALGLSEKFNNVIGTSISEAGIVGVGAGRAFGSGKLSVCEIMFGDFATLIVDQVVNGVDKFHKMFAKQLKIPLAIRIPYGMGRGYGPTHSQSPFELFAGLSEVRVVSYNPLIDYSDILRRLQDSGQSALIFEPKVNYGDRLDSWAKLLNGYNVEFFSSDLLAPTIRVRSGVNTQVRVITHGSAAKPALEALEKLDFDVDLLIVGDLSNPSSYINWLKLSDQPLVILEEKNTEVGYMTGRVVYALQSNSLTAEVIFNNAIKNIPANTGWESNLMLNAKTVSELITEAAL